MNLEQLVEDLKKRHNIETTHEIGRDISLKEIAAGTLQLVIDEKRGDVEKELKRGTGKNFKSLGKLELLNELEQEARQR